MSQTPGGTDNHGHLFWDCPFPPLNEIRENLEFRDLMRMDKGPWPRCGTGGFLDFLVSMVPLPVQLMLLRVLLTWLRLRLVGILQG